MERVEAVFDRSKLKLGQRFIRAFYRCPQSLPGGNGSHTMSIGFKLDEGESEDTVPQVVECSFHNDQFIELIETAPLEEKE